MKPAVGVLLVTFFSNCFGFVVDMESDPPSGLKLIDPPARNGKQLERIFGFGGNNNAVLATLHYARATVVIYNTQTTTAWKSCYTGSKTVTCSKRKRSISPWLVDRSSVLSDNMIGKAENGIYTVAPKEFYDQLEHEMEIAELRAAEKEARESKLTQPAVEEDEEQFVLELESSHSSKPNSQDDPSHPPLSSPSNPGENVIRSGSERSLDSENLDRMRFGFWGLGGSGGNSEPIHLAKTSTTTVVSTVFQTMFGTQIITISYQRCVAPDSPVNPAC